MNVGTPSSPCVQVCELDPGTKLCRGCGRTLEEIVAWGQMPEPDRLRLMRQLPARIAAARMKS
jgi:predicted Fe-S protein YdhL (DUF1289 family)